jgi:hypothetical protein
VTPNTWLYRVGLIPSNKTGVPVVLTNAKITKIQIGTEDVANYSLEIYEHEGNEVNLTYITTVNVSGVRTYGLSTSLNVTTGRQLAVMVKTGSPKNIGVDLVLKGGVV